MAQSPADYYRSLSATYTDAIRASDFKANIVMFFLSIVLGPVVAAQAKYPPFVTLPLLVSPFLIVFLCLFLALIPRYPRRGRSNFLVSRTATPADFAFGGSSSAEATQLQLRVAILSDILFWKTLCLRVSFFVCIATVTIVAALVLWFGH